MQVREGVEALFNVVPEMLSGPVADFTSREPSPLSSECWGVQGPGIFGNPIEVVKGT